MINYRLWIGRSTRLELFGLNMFQSAGFTPDGTFNTPGTLLDEASLGGKAAPLAFPCAPGLLLPLGRLVRGPFELAPLVVAAGLGLLLDHLVVSTTPTDGSKLFLA